MYLADHFIEKKQVCTNNPCQTCLNVAKRKRMRNFSVIRVETAEEITKKISNNLVRCYRRPDSLGGPGRVFKRLNVDISASSVFWYANEKLCRNG